MSSSIGFSFESMAGARFDGSMAMSGAMVWKDPMRQPDEV